MRVVIRKIPDAMGTSYEIDDFGAYVEALRARGIETPKVRYRIVIPSDIEDQFRAVHGEIESQVALFYRLGPSSGIEYDVVPQAPG